MNLRAYVNENGGSAQLAERLGVTREAVDHWIAGRRMPRRQMVLKIQEITCGAVTPDDLYAPTTPDEGAAA